MKKSNIVALVNKTKTLTNPHIIDMKLFTMIPAKKQPVRKSYEQVA
jgi:hypothetical protein